MSPHANGHAVAPAVVIQVALFPDGNVQAGADGKINEFTVRGMLGAAEALLVALIHQKQKEAGGIEPAPPGFTRKLLG